jgi:hypothetical protein
MLLQKAVHFQGHFITQLPCDQTVADHCDTEEVHLNQVADVSLVVVLESSSLAAKLSLRLVGIFELLQVFIITFLHNSFHLL